MLLDLFLYALLGWYLDGVLPASLREFGVPLPWYFPCSPRYWRDACSCGGGGVRDADAKRHLKEASALVTAAMAGATPMTGEQLARHQRFIEEPDAGLKAKVGGLRACRAGFVERAAIWEQKPLPACCCGDEPLLTAMGSHAWVCHLRGALLSFLLRMRPLSPSQEREGLCVSVRGLRKEFNTPDGVKVAVDGIDLTMYGGEIFVLLGECQAASAILKAECDGPVVCARSLPVLVWASSDDRHAVNS
jgi:hypothetical protein